MDEQDTLLPSTSVTEVDVCIYEAYREPRIAERHRFGRLSKAAVTLIMCGHPQHGCTEPNHRDDMWRKPHYCECDGDAIKWAIIMMSQGLEKISRRI